MPGAMGKAGKRRRAGGAVVGEEPEPRGEAGRQARPRERAWAGGSGARTSGEPEGGGQGEEKGVRWMPRCPGPKKDVASCEKPRGAAHRL